MNPILPVLTLSIDEVIGEYTIGNYNIECVNYTTFKNKYPAFYITGLTGDSNKINEIILSCLIRNARVSSNDISKKLKSHGIKRTPRSVLERINKLEEQGKIPGYTLKAQPKNFENAVMH